MNERDINQRVIVFFDYRKLKYSEAAKILGVANQRIEQWKKNERPIGAEYLQTLCLKFIDLNANWLLTGKGSMLNEEENGIEDEANEPIQPNKNCVMCEEKDVRIKDLKDHIESLKKMLDPQLNVIVKNDTAHCG